VNYFVLLQLASGSSSRHLGYIAGTTTWRFTWVLMYRLEAPSLPSGDDEYRGTFYVWFWLVVREEVVSG